MKVNTNNVTSKNAKVSSKSVSGVKAVEKNGKLFIFFNLTINDVTIYGCRVATGKDGDFIAFPSHQDANGKYWNYAYVSLSDDDSKAILAMVEAEVNK